MKKDAFPQHYILILLVTFTAIGAVLFSPGLTEIVTYFGISQKQAQLTLTTYLFGYAFSPLLYGPLSNCYGRKPAIYFGFSLAVFSALLCVVFAELHFFVPFIIARFFLALGGGVGLMMTFTMIGDVYKGAKATKVIAYMMLAFAIMPSLSIAFGSFLIKESNWLSLVYFFFFYAVAILLLTKRLPETSSQRDPQALQLKRILNSYLHQGKQGELVLGGIIIDLATSFLYVFSMKAPFIALSTIGMTISEFGLFNLLPPMGLLIGSILANRLADPMKPIQVILLGMLISAVGILMMLLSFYFGEPTRWKLFLPIPMIYIGLSLIFTNTTSLIMNDAKDKASASSIMSFINLFINASTVLTALFVQLTHPIFLPLIFSAVMIVLLFLYNRLLKVH